VKQEFRDKRFMSTQDRYDLLGIIKRL